MTDREKAIVMAYTGYTMLAGEKLGIFYKYVQEKLGRSVMTHELAYKEIQDAIEEAAKEDFLAIAKADNGWISVKDRLPENDDKVLCCSRTAKGIQNIIIGYYMGGMWRCGMNSNVTHWMPLPEIPEI